MSGPFIYLLGPSAGSRIPKFVTTTDKSGRAIFADGIPTTPPKSVCLDVSGVEIMDRMLTVGSELILSERAFEVLKNLRLPDDLVALDCQVTGMAGSQAGLRYKLCYTHQQHDVFHPTHGTARMFKGHLLHVFEWALAAEQLPSDDVFVGDAGEWFVSNDFVERVFANHLSGFGFTRVPVYQLETLTDSKKIS